MAKKLQMKQTQELYWRTREDITLVLNKWSKRKLHACEA